MLLSPKAPLIHVSASTTRTGERFISVSRVSMDIYIQRKQRMERMAATGQVTDWQMSHHETLAEARSCIMSLYGLGWFNKARRQLAALAREERA